MAKAQEKPEEKSSVVEAFVLCTCGFGEVGSIVELTPEDAATGQSAGVLDLHPDAIEAHR